MTSSLRYYWKGGCPNLETSNLLNKEKSIMDSKISDMK